MNRQEQKILELLDDGSVEWYGLDLIRRSDGVLKRGTIYVHLDRLEDKGLITSYRPDPQSARRLYKVRRKE